MSPAAADHAREILDQGYTVFERAWSDEEVDFMARAILDRVAEVAPGEQLWTEEFEPVTDGVASNISGINLWRLLSDRPELIDYIVKPELIEAFRGVLGDDMRLELVCSAVTDPTRPFFPWHHHIGGFDESVYPLEEGWPVVEGADRISAVMYLCDTLGDDDGQLLVYPRKVGEPTPPKGDRLSEWDGQLEVRVPRGSVVAMEQCTWHAVRPMQRTGYRILISCVFRSGEVPAPDWADPELRRAGEKNPLLASLLPGDAGEGTVFVMPDQAKAPPPPPESPPDPEPIAAALEATALGWRLDEVRWSHGQLIFSLKTPAGEPVVGEAAPATPDGRALMTLGEVAYSHRGELAREQVSVFREIVAAIHDAIRQIIHDRAA